MEDKLNLRQIIINSLGQLQANLEFFNQLNLGRRQFNKVLICGMGGSALIGDLLYYLKVKNQPVLGLKIPVFVHRSYHLPPDVDEQTLVIISSYSGNTEETISAFQKAKEKNLEIVGLASGGQLSEFFQRARIPWVKISGAQIPPRFSLGYQLNGLIKIFVGYGLLPQSAQDALISLTIDLNPAKLEDQAKLLSVKLFHKIPMIYSSEDNKALARFLKISFNESSKIPAFWNSFPEINHNETTGWHKNLGPFFFLFLSDRDDLPKIKKRMELTAKIIKDKNLPVEFIELAGDNDLAKMFWTIIFGEWLSYHLALIYGVDPGEMEIIEDFKKQLA